MHRTLRMLLPLLLGAAMMIVPSAGALAAWQVVTPAGGGASWYQYPAGTGGGTAGTGASGAGTAGAGTSGGTTTSGTGGGSTAGSGTGSAAGTGTGSGTTPAAPGATTCIGDGWYQTCTPSTTSTSGSTGSTSGSTGSGTAGSGSGATTGTTGGITLTADEQQLFNTVNQLRANHGLAPLALNATLVKLAREKSQDMITNNYFGHTSPTLGTPLQMQRNAGLNCQVMGGENIAGAANIGLAIFYFETSPPHMANILYPTYTVTGVGVVADGPYGVYVTEEFAGGC